MKKLILDTDIGVDCDDAVALALLMALQKEGFCDLLAISTCTARAGATAAVRAITDYYGAYDIPCGRMYSPVLPCDRTNNYAEKLMKKYKKAEAEEESVHLLRKTLAKAQEKVVLVAIGPLTMIAALLKSEGDVFSSLCGRELLREKVEALYTMSCRFCTSDGEWNIVQDIPSAQYVFANCPIPVCVCPGETGDEVFTGGCLYGKKEHPVWDSLVGFFEETSTIEDERDLKRESWDPLTCYAAVLGTEDFVLSPKGVVRIDDRGTSTFTPCAEGQHVVLRRTKDPREIAAKIDRHIF